MFLLLLYLAMALDRGLHYMAFLAGLVGCDSLLPCIIWMRIDWHE